MGIPAGARRCYNSCAAAGRVTAPPPLATDSQGGPSDADSESNTRMRGLPALVLFHTQLKEMKPYAFNQSRFVDRVDRRRRRYTGRSDLCRGSASFALCDLVGTGGRWEAQMTGAVDRTRRSFMSGAITSAVASSAFAAVASPALTAAAEPSPSRPIWPAADAADEKLFELWARRDVAAADMRAASQAAESAVGRMPAWARSGPAFVDKDGSPAGDSSGWPALPLELLLACDKTVYGITRWPMKVRWSRDEVHAEYSRLTSGLNEGQKWPAARRRRDRLLQAVAASRRAQKQEARKVGLPALERAHERTMDLVLDLENEILSLAPATPHTVAASVLIDLRHECRVGESFDYPGGGALIIAERVLRALRPQLRGTIAAVAGELLDNPATPIEETAIWTDRAPKSVAV